MTEDDDERTVGVGYVQDVLVYAKRVGGAGARQGSYEQSIEYYDLCITPPVPITVGLHIRIHRLVDSRIRPTPYIPSCGQITYNARVPGVIGEVVAVRTLEQRISEFIIRNDAMCHYPYAPDFVYLSVPHVPGITLRLTMWQSMIRYLLSLVPMMFTDTKDIQLEDGVPITDHITRAPGGGQVLTTLHHPYEYAEPKYEPGPEYSRDRSPTIDDNPELNDSLYKAEIVQIIINRVFYKSPEDDGIALVKVYDPFPIAGLVLVLTAIQCAIDEWDTGAFAAVKFSEEAYSTVYEQHVNELNTYEQESGEDHVVKDICKEITHCGRYHAKALLPSIKDKLTLTPAAISDAVASYKRRKAARAAPSGN